MHKNIRKKNGHWESFDNSEKPVELKLRVIADPKDRAISELEEKVRERTRELEGANKILQEAIRHEIELSRLQSEFITMVSHELKSPISGIRLLIDRMASRRSRKHQVTKEYYTVIRREINRLQQLINRLLEIQKIGEKRVQYRFILASIAEIAETAINHLSPQAEAKRIRLELQMKGDIPQVTLDKAAIANALENLIDNAIKYSPSGTCVTVTIWAFDHQVFVEVRDQGVGIDPDDLPRIFEKFYRGRLGDQYSVKGTGLGLALVKAVVEAHGGTVEVTSTPGESSCFSLRLPIISQ